MKIVKAKKVTKPKVKKKTKPKPDPMPKVIKNSNVKLKSGETVTQSGIYRTSKSGQNATLVKGEPAPPTAESGEKWVLTVDTNPSN